MRHLTVLLLVLVPILLGYSRVYTTDGMIYRAVELEVRDDGVEIETEEGETLWIPLGNLKRVLHSNGKTYRFTEESDNERWHAGLADVEKRPTEETIAKIRQYLMEVLKDPSSYEGVAWSKVHKEGKVYTIDHKYRARNGYGGLDLGLTRFYLDHGGNVLRHKSLD